MDLFSNFCNICYKTDEENLKDISQENLKDTLITYVGHADILNHNIINLCQLCCENLYRSNKFREMCYTNLIHLRQRVVDMKSKLELECDTCSVQNTLQIFVREEVLRRKTRNISNRFIPIPAEYHQVVKSSADSISNRQIINVQSDMNEIAGDINNAVEVEESSFMKEELDMGNETLRRSESTVFVKFERESDKQFDACDINNSNESDALQIEFTKDEFHVNNEIEINTPEDRALRNIESECGKYVDVPAIESTQEGLHMKQEKSSSEDLQLETIQDKFSDGLNVAFEFANVCTIVNIETCNDRSIKIEENAKDDRLRNGGCDDKSTGAIINMQPSHPAVLQSGANKRAYISADPLGQQNSTHSDDGLYRCTICSKAFTQSRNLSRHERRHSDDGFYKCTICSKEFTQWRNFSRHERKHSDGRPYKCTVCNKAFLYLSGLGRHSRTHTADRPYNCTVCLKTFKDPSHLIAHARIHSGERPYKCNVCEKAFRYSSNLTTHARVHNIHSNYE